MCLCGWLLTGQGGSWGTLTRCRCRCHPALLPTTATAQQWGRWRGRPRLPCGPRSHCLALGAALGAACGAQRLPWRPRGAAAWHHPPAGPAAQQPATAAGGQPPDGARAHAVVQRALCPVHQHLGPVRWCGACHAALLAALDCTALFQRMHPNLCTAVPHDGLELHTHLPAHQPSPLPAPMQPRASASRAMPPTWAPSSPSW